MVLLDNESNHRAVEKYAVLKLELVLVNEELNSTLRPCKTEPFVSNPFGYNSLNLISIIVVLLGLAFLVSV